MLCTTAAACQRAPQGLFPARGSVPKRRGDTAARSGEGPVGVTQGLGLCCTVLVAARAAVPRRPHE